MENDSRHFLDPPRWIRRAPALDGIDPVALAARDLGRPVASARSSWTRRRIVAGVDCFVKTYDYPTTRDRRRGALRNTWLARSRAAREAAASDWLRAHGFAAPEVWAVVEWRTPLRFLRRALLVTRAWPGITLDRIYEQADRHERERLRVAVDAWVGALHAAGFRDRNLDPRNILVAGAPDREFHFCKIDSPRHRIVTAGQRGDRLARADRARLDAGLLDIAAGVRPPERSWRDQPG